MSFVPVFELYDSTGLNLEYTFINVVDIQGWPDDSPRNTEISNIRGDGSINIPGGNGSYDIVISGILTGTDYEDLTDKMNDMINSIVSHTNYVLSLPTSSTTADEIHVRRLVKISFDKSNRTTFQRYTVIFRALSW